LKIASKSFFVSRALKNSSSSTWPLKNVDPNVGAGRPIRRFDVLPMLPTRGVNDCVTPST